MKKQGKSFPVKEQVKLANQTQLHPKWVAGFVDGEGCFHVGVNRNLKSRLGIQILPEFTVVQHSRDTLVLKRLKQFFGCGVVRVNNGDRMAFRVRKIEDLTMKIIPFFEIHFLETRKCNDFSLFKEVVLLMQKKSHLKSQGIEQIKDIANRMNRKGILNV